MIWCLAKHKVAMNNVCQKGTEIENLVRNAFMEIGPSDWDKHCKHVTHLAAEMWQRDGLLHEAVESLCFKVNTGSSDDDNTSDHEEDESDSN